MNLTEESLSQALVQIREQVQDQGETMNILPTHFYIHADLARIYDRLLNPWKGRRAKWLRKRR